MFSLGRCVTIATGALRATPAESALLRPADQVADPAGLVSRSIGRPRTGRAERSGPRRARFRRRADPLGSFLGLAACPGNGTVEKQRRQTGGAENSTTKLASCGEHSAGRSASPPQRVADRFVLPRYPSPEAGKPGTMGRHERDHDPCRTTRRCPPHRPPRCRDVAGCLCRNPDDAVSCRPVGATPRRSAGRPSSSASRATSALRSTERARSSGSAAAVATGTAPSVPARSLPSTSRRTGRTRVSAARCCSPCSSGWSRKAARSAIIWVLRDNPGRFFYRRLGGREVRHKNFVVGGKRIEAAGYAWRDLPRYLETARADGRPERVITS